MTSAKTIAFLGLGVMGGPMAGHLLNAGHRVTVWNRTRSRAEAWGAKHPGGSVAASAAEAATGADVVLACLGNDDDVAGVVLGEAGVLAAMPKGATFVDHTTVSPALARQIAEAASELGLNAIDAPVSGGQAGAENGKLSIMCGGTQAAMDAATPVMEAYALRITHVGAAGAGQSAKAVNQVCIAGVLAGLSEGVRLAQANGLDMDKVFEAISSGAAQSWQMNNRWATMAKDEFDFGFAVDWMRKDLAIALSAAKEAGLPLPVTALVDQFYAEVQALGGNRQDTSSLLRRFPRAKPA